VKEKGGNEMISIIVMVSFGIIIGIFSLWGLYTKKGQEFFND